MYCIRFSIPSNCQAVFFNIPNGVLYFGFSLPLNFQTEFLNGRTYTYSQVKQSAISVASALHRLGYKKGDVVLSFSTNNIDVCILMLACASLGLWYSAANPTFTAGTVAFLLNTSVLPIK